MSCSIAAENTKSFPKKPSVGGMPASESNKIVMLMPKPRIATADCREDRLPRAMCFRYVSKTADERERSESHERVREQVEQTATVAARVVVRSEARRDQTHHRVTRVCDRRVSQYSLFRLFCMIAATFPIVIVKNREPGHDTTTSAETPPNASDRKEA